jgi:uncharacterized protein DUF6933
MAFLSLTKKAAATLKIDISKAIVHGMKLPEMEDWVVDTIWHVKKQPGILFYNKATGFVVALNPADYSLDYCLEILKEQLCCLLTEHGLGDKVDYFSKLFSVIHICRNNDRSAVAYMTQSKRLINYWLDSNNERRVNNSYDLLKRINDDMRKVNGQYQQIRIKEFLYSVSKIDKNCGIVKMKLENENNQSIH